MSSSNLHCQRVITVLLHNWKEFINLASTQLKYQR